MRIPDKSLALRDALRKTFKELTFAEIKDTAGAGGIPLSELSHLQQKSLPARGASKAELLDVITSLLKNLGPTERIFCVSTFISACVKKRSSLSDEIEFQARRYGYEITESGSPAIPLHLTSSDVIALRSGKEKAPDCAKKRKTTDPHQMKPKLFVGSSKEAIDLAQAVKENLDERADVTLWTENVFRPSRSTLESLEELVKPDGLWRVRFLARRYGYVARTDLLYTARQRAS